MPDQKPTVDKLIRRTNALFFTMEGGTGDVDGVPIEFDITVGGAAIVIRFGKEETPGRRCYIVHTRDLIEKAYELYKVDQAEGRPVPKLGTTEAEAT